MANEIIVNVSAGETRVALLERGSFTELHIERTSDLRVGGMVVMGRVTRVLPGMQAAFVDIGLEKAAFLYVGDYLDDSGMSQAESDDEEESPRPRRSRGRNGQRQPPPKIDTLLKAGQEITVQVAKEPIGTKGARITSHISIPGRHLVLTPWARKVGVSRRIDSDRERRRLREIVSRVKPPDLGFIIRTAGEEAREADLEADVKYLTSVWDDIEFRRSSASSPAPLYSELSLPLRVIRDFANSKTKRIVIDNAGVYTEMNDFLTRFVADPKPVLEHYQGPLPIFDQFGIESTIDANLGKKVWLKSGGYLIVDQSEALTAIDVNTGRYVGKRDLEETVLKTNLEAVKEVVNQLRFRNIGGLIIVDLIDMETAANRDKVYRAFQEALRQDKSRTNILKISELGLVEMTRKRTRENLVQMLCEPCDHCEGRGYVLSSESIAYKVLREIRKDLPRFCGHQIAVTVNPAVADVLLGQARQARAELTAEIGREIEIRARPGMHQEQFEVTALDEGPPVSLSLGWLADREREKPDEPEEQEEAISAEKADGAEDAGEPALAGKIAPVALDVTTGAVEDAPAADSDELPEATPAVAAECEDDDATVPVPTSPQVPDTSPSPPGNSSPPVERASGRAARGASPEPATSAVKASEMLDVEAESPILPDSSEHEES